MNKLGTFALALALVSVPLPALAACGDGVLGAPEECDDGNLVDTDGCSSTCTVEAGYTCARQFHVDIVNPSFESDPFPSGTSGGGWTRLTPADVDWVGGACWPAGDGSFSIDMNGSDRQGTMYQTLTTMPGQHYVVTFLGSANPADGMGGLCTDATSKDLTVRVADGSDYRAGTQARVLTLVRAAGLSDWHQYSYAFDAVSDTTTLVFEGSAPSFNGPMIDRVAIPMSICTLDSCGNGSLGAGEACDDHNHVSGDGCSATCTIEPGYTCPTAGSACTATCGDGIIGGTERCDDANATDGDGCTSCAIDPGYACVYDGHMVRSVCMMTCGNGTLDPGEQCDDHNTNDLDACSNRCLLGPDEPCFFGSQCQLGVCGALGNHCTGCYDSAPAGGVDFGCMTAVPACDTSGSAPLCVGCLADPDCPAGSTCDLLSHACNVGPPVDAGRPDAGMPPDVGPPPFDVGPPPADAGRDAASTPDASPTPDASTMDAGPRVGGASGGACLCAMHAQHRGTAWQALLALGGVALFVRRRRARR